MSMTSKKPYLINALYNWIVDNNMTPYILVNVDYPDVQVPMEYARDGKIVLDISPVACRGLHLDERIVFSARFSGEAMQIVIPSGAVLAIYAQENGNGMEFPVEYAETSRSGSAAATSISQPRRKPALTLVKKDNQKENEHE